MILRLLAKRFNDSFIYNLNATLNYIIIFSMVLISICFTLYRAHLLTHGLESVLNHILVCSHLFTTPLLCTQVIMMSVLFIDHMKDHSSGCTFGGCASYSMSSQPNWNIYHVSAGFWLYTSNEWPRPLYDNFPDTGSCTDYYWGTSTSDSVAGCHFGSSGPDSGLFNSATFHVVDYSFTGSCTIYLQRTSSLYTRTNGQMVVNHRKDIVSIQTDELRTTPFTTGDRRTCCF